VGFFEPLAAETWAAGQALQFEKEMGYSRIILEGDAKLVVDAITSVTN
jgi:ribonuclease HI